jgi:hypothetical protein
MDQLISSVEHTQFKHRKIDDDYYSCPKSDGGCANDCAEGCTCGVDTMNEARALWVKQLKWCRNEAINQLARTESFDSVVIRLHDVTTKLEAAHATLRNLHIELPKVKP